MKDNLCILNDKAIIELCKSDKPMIAPFEDKSVRETDPHFELPRRTLSYGVSSFGYDVRLAEKVQVFTNLTSEVIDPKRPNHNLLTTLTVHTDIEGARYVILPPHTYALGHTVETFDIPRDVMVIAVGKSTYARSGIVFNTTPIEAGFKGEVVIELSNCTNLPCKIYLNEGIGQFVFFRGEPCLVSYADRDGKYQNQAGITLGKS